MTLVTWSTLYFGIVVAVEFDPEDKHANCPQDEEKFGKKRIASVAFLMPPGRTHAYTGWNMMAKMIKIYPHYKHVQNIDPTRYYVFFCFAFKFLGNIVA